MPRLSALSLVFVLAFSAPTVAAEPLPFNVPEGFRVSLYADDELAHDIHSMTLDSQGRVVVAGPKYVKVLHDTDGDSQADKATLFSERPASGAHGMYFHGPDLICTGDNSVMRLSDRDGNGTADGEPEVWANLRNPEHGANGVVRGPDGWFYVICGNDAGVSTVHARGEFSPVKEPRCGAVVRFSPDGQQSEVVAHGFRNPYKGDFNQFGSLFTVDSDNEREYHLPWYTPTRLFDVAFGREHGWLLTGWTQSWNRPESFFDNVERVAEIGRGSPTGMVVYRHRSFPEKYRGGVFSACWTLGRIYFMPLKRHEASYKSEPQIFLQSIGDSGFAPVDMVIGPGGEMYIAVGGRRTRGGVFKVEYQEAAAAPDGSDLQQVLSADQPLASWSRARWVPLAQNCGKAAFEAAAVDSKLNSSERIRALEVLVEVFGGVSASLTAVVAESGDSELTSRAAWAVSRHADAAAAQLLALMTQKRDPIVARAAWEALGASAVDASIMAKLELDWASAAENPVRGVRAAALWAARRRPELARPQWLTPGSDSLEAARITPRTALFSLWSGGDPSSELRGAFVRTCLVVLDTSNDPTLRLEAIRLLQIGIGDIDATVLPTDVCPGYRTKRAEAGSLLRLEDIETLTGRFPTRDPEVNRELGRLLAMVGAEQSNLLQAISHQFRQEPRLEDDIHYLVILATLPGQRSERATIETARALAAVEQQESSNWPLVVGRCFEELCRRDPKLADALVNDVLFGSRQHALFVKQMLGQPRQQGARRLLARAQRADNEEFWTPELVEAVSALPSEEVRPALREQWDNFAVRDAIALVLAGNPEELDRQRLVEALGSVQTSVVIRAAEALAKVKPPGSTIELALALGALRNQSALPAAQYNASGPVRAREVLRKLLRHWSGQDIAVKEMAPNDPAAAYRPWMEWFDREHPEEAKRLVATGAVDPAEWLKRLATITWESGDPKRGNIVFERKACHRCHRDSGHLGPSLAGVTSRLNRDDLFAAIVDPNREVAPLYQTATIVTTKGHVYQGQIVYESPEGTLLQTGADTSVRVTEPHRIQRRPGANSLMPTGLLNETTNQELADVYAYLKTLTK